MAGEPTTYTPLLRRLFVNERAKEFEDATALYDNVKAWQGVFQETHTTIGRRVFEHIPELSDHLIDPVLKTLFDLIDGEQQIWALPEPAFSTMDMREFVEFKNRLNAKQYFFANQATHLDLIHEAIVDVLCGTLEHLPLTQAPSPFSIPLLYALPAPYRAIEHVFATLGDRRLIDAHLFIQTSNQLLRNLCTASGADPDGHGNRPIKTPSEQRLPLDQAINAYFARTPFHALFCAPVPLQLTQQDRFTHTHVVGGSGSGKTTLIENLILHDLQSPDPPSVVLIDPHSDLIRKLVRADIGIEDRLVIIDPRDIAHPPALNIFALNQERLGAYDEVVREQVTAGVIQTFNYLFSGLTNLTLTGKQDVFFRYVARLMLSLPDAMGRNATILDMMKLMGDPTPYADAIAALPDIPREFFQRDFMSKTFEQTKEQIRYRLQAIIENPTMARLFTSEETKVDLFTELNRGSVILVDTAKDFLKENSSTFGRLFLSLVLQAVLERAAIKASERKPTFLYVDEAASFFSSNIDDLLTEARKYSCGCIFAHQYLDQATGSLRASLAANTGIKFASGLSANDARAMAPDMRTTPDFILGQPRMQFAAHIRNVTPQAVSIPIRRSEPPATLGQDAVDTLLARNRIKVSSCAKRVEAVAEPPVDNEIADDTDISPDW